ncbi:metallophosphoesterase [Speluncibacter jeojiensis]|uniref:Metallophosphoesterase n=1 Tax=Speluncibacter jeojiensis TaxID=2710754 RepID=A0A9X4M448_9ACTN|nr:metallophosphoesterase [Rhodococcus sp. D2-41]MDG3016454.1 metallophosphoesterase [Corynebacteriales bacterium D3-21]
MASVDGLFLRTPARVAIAGDWHANTEYGLDAIAHAARRSADVVVHLGDFGYHFMDSYLDALDAALSAHDMVLGFVEGNHEDFDWLLAQPIADDGLRYLRPRVVHLPRGLRWTWGDVECLALGGAYSIDRFLRVPGTSWWPQEVIGPGDVELVVGAGRADVMFCHDCPAGVDVPGMARDRFGFPEDELAASEANRDRLRFIVDNVQPHRLWHGHFHHRHRAILEGSDYRTVIDGLGRDKEPIDNNMVVVKLSELGAHHASRRLS